MHQAVRPSEKEMKRIRVQELLRGERMNEEVLVMGWVRHFRSNRFIALNDGSCLSNIQAVVDYGQTDEAIIKHISVGAAVRLTGKLVESQGRNQNVEIQVREMEVLGTADPKQYPLQPKKHRLEFLRKIAHLRPRTQTFGAVFRIRHALAFAIHQYFNDRGYFCIHTPVITGSDAEGAGELFQVTTFNLNNVPRNEEGSVDFKADFFGKPANLTVSGQLEAELGAMGLGQVYTFGPTFRAENSNTSRHLAEFWMIEPEVAFADLNDNMDLAEDFLKHVIRYALEHCREDLNFLEQYLLEEERSKPQNERSPQVLRDKLRFVADSEFRRISYTEAIDILRNSKPNKKKKFAYLIKDWGVDLQSEHERYLVEKHFGCPVILFDYPARIKAFYMRLNKDGRTVRAMDILFPEIGEIVGGSQREERYDVLRKRIDECNIPEEEMWWYLETRKFGTAPHSGFGLGFERLVQFVTGMGNIRDVIPFPRFPGSAEF